MGKAKSRRDARACPNLWATWRQEGGTTRQDKRSPNVMNTLVGRRLGLAASGCSLGGVQVVSKYLEGGVRTSRSRDYSACLGRFSEGRKEQRGRRLLTVY